jgi:hypothetical protein
MFEIKYDLAYDDTKIIEVDEVSLRTRHFPGTITLKNERFCIFIDHQKVPVLDSAFNMLRICDVLVQKKDGTEDFEFSYSGRKITFQKDGGKVKIIPSFSVVTLDVPVDDFKEGIKLFFKKVVQDVMNKSQSLKMNALLFDYLRQAEKI